MGVITPERERVEPAQPPPPPEPPPRRDIPWGLIAIGVVVALLATGVISFRDLLPSIDNPFKGETTVQSGPVLLKSIQDIGEYRAAAGNFQVVVDLKTDTELPDEILGERTLFVAFGTVDAGVDLSSLDAQDVQVSEDRTAATITLPHARLFEPEIDVDQSYVYDRERGLFNKIGGLFSDDADQRALYIAAENELMKAARQGSGLVPRAEKNTRMMLQSMLQALGFRTVVIRFGQTA